IAIKTAPYTATIAQSMALIDCRPFTSSFYDADIMPQQGNDQRADVSKLVTLPQQLGPIPKLGTILNYFCFDGGTLRLPPCTIHCANRYVLAI
ncbi:MAG: hypothetical protein AAGL17_04680, partial [Cyanobacteria bacterium J06576_12]